jgi:hypothetical protein
MTKPFPTVPPLGTTGPECQVCWGDTRCKACGGSGHHLRSGDRCSVCDGQRTCQACHGTGRRLTAAEAARMAADTEGA